MYAAQMRGPMDYLESMVRAFANTKPWQGAVAPDYFPNFLGVMTEQLFIADYAPSNNTLAVNAADNMTPAPGFADGEVFFEQAAIHEAVKAARGKFIMVELGGGYAARTVDAHAALQLHNPMHSRYVVVEAEPTHFNWALRHMRTNDINPDDLDHLPRLPVTQRAGEILDQLEHGRARRAHHHLAHLVRNGTQGTLHGGQGGDVHLNFPVNIRFCSLTLRIAP